MKNSIGLWAKELAGASVGALLVLIAGLQDNGNLNLVEWISAAAALLGGVLLVSFVKNATTGFWYYGKAFIQGLVAALASFSSAVSDGSGWPPSGAEWLLILLAFLGGAGITAVVPSARRSDPDQFTDRHALAA